MWEGKEKKFRAQSELSDDCCAITSCRKSMWNFRECYEIQQFYVIISIVQDYNVVGGSSNKYKQNAKVEYSRKKLNFPLFTSQKLKIRKNNRNKKSSRKLGTSCDVES